MSYLIARSMKKSESQYQQQPDPVHRLHPKSQLPGSHSTRYEYRQDGSGLHFGGQKRNSYLSMVRFSCRDARNNRCGKVPYRRYLTEVPYLALDQTLRRWDYFKLRSTNHTLATDGLSINQSILLNDGNIENIVLMHTHYVIPPLSVPPIPA